MEVEFLSSIPSGMVPVFRANSDAFVSSDEVVGDNRNPAEFHVPHGNRHITEFSNLMLSLAARAILEGFKDLALNAAVTSETE